MAYEKTIRVAGAAGVMALAMLAGCQSAADKAVDQAKTQAAATNTAQQVQYVDDKGQTVTTTVTPPAAPGGPEQVATVVTPPAPGAPVPAATAPIVRPLPPPPADLIGPAQDANNANNGTPVEAQPGVAAGTPATQTAAVQPFQLTVPAGTEIAIRINESISVKHSHAGEHFSGEVVEPIHRDGADVIPRGTLVHGRIDEAHRRGHFKGRSVLELRLTSMTLNGNEYALDTHENVHTKKGKGKRSAGFIGGMTGAGMLIGGIATGGVGLAIGGAAGAGAGTLIAGTTGNRDIDIPAESVVHFRLADDLVVQN
jgi:hypothetical protein